MESFLNTEIARLVYGYLVEESCQNAASLFLENSVHMQECLSVVRKGRRFSTKKCGKTLIEILEILADVTSLVRNFSENRESDLEEFMQNLVGLLIFVDEAQTVPRKPRIQKDLGCEKGLNYDSNLTIEKELEQCKSPLQDLENSEDDYDIQNRPGLQVLLEKKEWHERLAENINKAVGSGNETSEPEKLALEKVLEKKTVETIVNTFEADPIFEEILKELVGPVSRSSPSNADDTEQEGEETPTLNEENLEIPVEKNEQEEETVAVQNNQANVQNVKDDTSADVGGFFVMEQNADNSIPQQQHSSVSSIQTSPQPSLTLIPIVKHAQLEKPLVIPTKPPVLKLTPTTSSGPPQSTQILIQTSPVIQPGAATFQMAAPKSPQVVSIISTSGSPLLKDSTSTVSPIPCSVISRFEVVGPKVFFKKDPNSLPFHSKIHIQGETSQKPRMDILPKIMEPLKVQVDDCSQTAPNAGGLQGSSEIPSEPVVIKRSGVRTRGGKRGGRKPQTRLKAIAPNLPKRENPLQLLIVSNDQPPKLPTVNSIEQLTNRPTALSCDTIQKSDAFPVIPSDKGSTEEAGNKHLPSVENQKLTTEESSEKVSATEKLNVSEDESKVTEECTPEQSNSCTVNFKERLSLSSPRRGSHVRTLEFNTPPKGINARRANTSPKNSAKNRHVPHRVLKHFRRGGLFNSPSPTKTQEHVQNTESQSLCQVGQTVNVKKPNAWDSDLRVYTENEDIPTLVGLQRKKPSNSKGKDKISSIEKISDKADDKPKNSYLYSIEEEGLNETSHCSLPDEETPSKSNNSTSKKENKEVQKEISCAEQTVVDLLNSPSSNFNSVKSTNVLNEDNTCHTPPDCLSPTHQLSLKNNNSLLGSCTKSPGNSSLESTLIKECARIENLNKTISENEGLNKLNEKQHTFTTPFKIDQNSKMTPNSEMFKFQTPAKTVLTPNSKQVVEMTPISQIRWEINELGKTKLVTPTLPQTPKDEVQQEEEVSPISDKSDISKESVKGKTKSNPTKKNQKAKTQKKLSDPNSPVCAKTKLKRNTKSMNNQEKNFNVEKTIKKCLKQAKNIIYGKSKVSSCNLSLEIKEDDKVGGVKTRSKKSQKIMNKSPTGTSDKLVSENTNDIEPTKTPLQSKDPELVTKNVTRQIDIVDDESGGSFPHLYLSEDEVTPTDKSQRNTNVQIISDPSLLGNKTPQFQQNEKSLPNLSNIDKKVTKETIENHLKQNELLLNNKTDNKSVMNNINDFKYTFSVIDEGSGELMSKVLEISPYIDLFELSPTNTSITSKHSDENKIKTKEEESVKSRSLPQKEQIDSNRKQGKQSFHCEPSPDIDKRKRVRSSCSSNEEFDPHRRKKQCLSRSRYKEAYSQSTHRKDYDHHFKERTRYPRRRDKTPFSARRSRYSRVIEESLPSRRPSKSWSNERNDYRRKKSFNSPYTGNQSDWHLKDNFEEDERYIKGKDSRKAKQSEYYPKHTESRRSEKEDLLQLKSKEIQEIINQNKELNRRLQALEGNSKTHKQNISSKEEGELSDTSCSVSPNRKKPDGIFSNKKLSLNHSSSVAEDCRTTLLKELDVDSFLSIVHGSDENKPI